MALRARSKPSNQVSNARGSADSTETGPENSTALCGPSSRPEERAAALEPGQDPEEGRELEPAVVQAEELPELGRDDLHRFRQPAPGHDLRGDALHAADGGSGTLPVHS